MIAQERMAVRASPRADGQTSCTLKKAALRMRNEVHFLMRRDGYGLARVDTWRSGASAVPVGVCLSIVRCWIAAEIFVLAMAILVRLAA